MHITIEEQLLKRYGDRRELSLISVRHRRERKVTRLSQLLVNIVSLKIIHPSLFIRPK